MDRHSAEISSAVQVQDLSNLVEIDGKRYSSLGLRLTVNLHTQLVAIMVSFLQFVASILPGAIASTAVTSMPTNLNITVIGARNNQSTLECWSLEPGFTSSTQPGIAGSASLSLGPVGDNATYTIVPARLDGGIHNAPVRQWVIFLSGLAHITLPHSEDEAWILGGKHGTILALDTAGVSADGHYTEYPSDELTVAMAVSLGDEEPAHQVLYQGACKATEVDF